MKWNHIVNYILIRLPIWIPTFRSHISDALRPSLLPKTVALFLLPLGTHWTVWSAPFCQRDAHTAPWSQWNRIWFQCNLRPKIPLAHLTNLQTPHFQISSGNWLVSSQVYLARSVELLQAQSFFVLLFGLITTSLFATVCWCNSSLRRSRWSCFTS